MNVFTLNFTAGGYVNIEANYAKSDDGFALFYAGQAGALIAAYAPGVWKSFVKLPHVAAQGVGADHPPCSDLNPKPSTPTTP